MKKSYFRFAFLTAILLLIVSQFFTNRIAVYALPVIDPDNVTINHEFSKTDDGSGNDLHLYGFSINFSQPVELPEGVFLKYRWTFDGEPTEYYSDGSITKSYPASTDVRVVEATVALFGADGTDDAPVEYVNLPTAYYKNGQKYTPSSVLPDEAPEITEKDVIVDVAYEVINQTAAKYYFTLSLNGIDLPEKFSLKADWTFDGDMFSSDRSFDMTTIIDSDKTHSLKIKAYVVDNDTGEIVLSVDLPSKYYKDGKVLQNYEDKTIEEPSRNGLLKMFYLPIIAVVLLIIYFIYFRKQNYTAGLDVTIDRLSNVMGTTSAVEKILGNEKYSDKRKLRELRLIFKTMKLDVTGTANMLKSYSLESSVSVDTKLAVEKLNLATEHLNKIEYEKLTAQELSSAINDFLEKHVKQCLSICRQIVATNNKYLKKHYDDQF